MVETLWSATESETGDADQICDYLSCLRFGVLIAKAGSLRLECTAWLGTFWVMGEKALRFNHVYSMVVCENIV